VSRRSSVDWILHLYPRAWRDRYGEELRDLLKEVTENGDLSPSRAVFGLFSSGFALRMRSSWRTLVFTGAILAFAGGAVFVANCVEYGQPSGIAIATHKAQPRVHPQAASTQSAHSPTGSATQTPEVGPIPQSAFQPNGIDLSQVPDFIPTMSNGKVVGFIPKSQIFPTSSAPQTPAELDASSIHAVYGPDLTTIIGYMYPGQVFVPLGETPPPLTTPRGQAVTPPTLPPPGAG
jgi:hypothetical protein